MRRVRYSGHQRRLPIPILVPGRPAPGSARKGNPQSGVKGALQRIEQRPWGVEVAGIIYELRLYTLACEGHAIYVQKSILPSPEGGSLMPQPSGRGVLEHLR